MDCQKTRCFTLFVFTLCISVLCGCASGGGHGPVGKIKDEALSTTPPRLPDSFGFADEDFFQMPVEIVPDHSNIFRLEFARLLQAFVLRQPKRTRKRSPIQTPAPRQSSI